MSNKYKVKCLVSLVDVIEIDTQDSAEALGGVINKAREIVTNRYNNSIWDTKLADISIASVEKTEVVYENEEILETFEDHISDLAYHEHSRAIGMNPPHTMTVAPPVPIEPTGWDEG
jgi:hypothetical protein